MSLLRSRGATSRGRVSQTWRAPTSATHAGSMAQGTHATLATFRMDLEREAEQRAVLDRVIVPGVAASPGFVSGHWTLDRAAGESFVLLTFESVEHAEAMVANVRANADNQRASGLELVSITVLEVIATA